MSDKFKAPEKGQDELHFLDYWRIIRIRKAVILTVFFLVMLTTAGVTTFLPNKYESEAAMVVQKDQSDVEEFVGGPGVDTFDPYWMQTQFEILKSPAILDGVIEEVGLRAVYAEDYGSDTPLELPVTRKILSSNLSISQTRNTSKIEVKAIARDPQLAADICDSVIDQYKAFRKAGPDTRAKAGIDALQTQLATIESEVEELDLKATEFLQEHQIIDIAGMGSVNPESLTPESLQLYSRTRVELNSVLQQLQAQLEEIEAVTDPDERIQTLLQMNYDPNLSELIGRKYATEQQLVVQERTLTPQNPKVLESKALLSKIDDQINSVEKGIIKGINAKIKAHKAQVDQLEMIIQGEASQSSLTQAFREYSKIKRKLEYQRRLADAVRMRLRQESVDAAIPSTESVRTLGSAEPIQRPISPKWGLNLVLGGIVGLIIGIGLAFFIEYLDTSVKTIDDVERTLQAPVIGVIPQNVGHLIHEGADSPAAEAYRVLRTNLLFSRKDQKHNTITVVSGGAGEGKSTTLFNLATIFAQNGNRVLVVDSDLRRPSIHKIVGVSNSSGLTNYLLKQAPVEELIQTTDLPMLDVLPSGKLPSSSMGVLNSPRMQELVDDLKSRYDFVFFDSPPIMGISDASVLCSMVDVSVQVIQYRKYPQAMTIRAKQMVEKIGQNLVGVVLNNINMSQDSDYYYYSGYYYDYYSKDKESEDPDEVPSSGRNGKGGDRKESGSSGKRGRDLKKKY